MDTHATTKQAAVAGLQGVVDRVLDDDWRRWFWLCFVPLLDRFVDRRQGFVLIDELLGLGVTGFGGEQRDYCGATRRDVWLQRFPGLMAYRACSTSWMMLLDLSLDMPISSLTAAKTTQNAGWDRKSTVNYAVALPA